MDLEHLMWIHDNAILIEYSMWLVIKFIRNDYDVDACHLCVCVFEHLALKTDR